MATEVFSVNEVLSIHPQSNEVLNFEPFYSYRHATLARQAADLLAGAPASIRKSRG